MKKKVYLFAVLVAAVMCFMALSASAVIYKPDSDGLYTVELEMSPGNDYMMFVLKGNYDQTNYIEAYNAAKDSDILYFEQKSSDENGKVTFGPFVPMGYYDATVIVGGTNLDELYLAGNLSAKGVSNAASIVISGLENEYLVKGFDQDIGFVDLGIKIKAEVLDSFGYPSVTDEEISIKLENADEGISLENGVLTISGLAKAQTFSVVACAGDITKTVYVNVLRNAPVYRYIEVFADEAMTESVNKISVTGTADNYPAITVYAKTFDQYGEELEDTYSYVYEQESVGATFIPVEGTKTLSIYSQNSDVKKNITIKTVTRPDYQQEALLLYNFIPECESKISEDKNISVDGKDIYPEETWTTQASADVFWSAIKTAKAALEKYGTDGYLDDDYSDELSALVKAKTAYEASFKAGTRKDVTEISINSDDIVIVGKTTYEISAQTAPAVQLTTDVLTWTSSDENVVTVTAGTAGKATLKGVSSGNAVVAVSTRTGLTASVNVTVIQKATEILISPSEITSIYQGEKAIVKARISPKESTDVIEWTYNAELMDLVIDEYIEGAYRVVAAEIVPKASGTSKIYASAVYGEVTSPRCSVTTVMPDWQAAEMPVASVNGGSIVSGTAVSLSSSTPGTTIYYTLDGTTPSRTNGRLYKNPIIVQQSLTLKAIAVASGYYDSEIAEYEYNVVNTRVSVSSAVARAGDTAEVYVDVSGLEGAEWAGILVNFDPSVLQCVSYDVSDEYSGQDVQVNVEDELVSIICKNAEGKLPDGRLMSLVFKVSDDALEGESVIIPTITFVYVDGEGSCDGAGLDGKITINNYLLGDADNDGKIALSDVLIITQYVAGNEDAIENILLEASDVDGDGDVDNDDAILISKYCVGWDVQFVEANKPPQYRIISGYDIGQKDDNLWTLYYTVYDPFTGMKLEDVSSVNTSEKASELSSLALESGTVIKVSDNKTIDENKDANFGKVDFSNLVWIKSMDESSMTVVPVDENVACKNCASEYVNGFAGATYKDFFGNEQSSNVVKITGNTKFSVIKRNSLDDNFFADAIISSVSLDDAVSNSKNTLCYNSKSENRDGDYVTIYAAYKKAFVLLNNKGEAAIVIIIVNDNDAAAYRNIANPCTVCQ